MLRYHAEPVRLGGSSFTFDEDLIGRLADEFWDSLEGAAALASYIAQLRDGAAFDLEFAFDETPSERSVASCVSTADEIVFVIGRSSGARCRSPISPPLRRRERIRLPARRRLGRPGGAGRDGGSRKRRT